MKITTSILTSVFAILMVMPSAVAAAYSDVDGWPLWVGREDNLYYTSKQRPEMAAKYLPLSLIKTGRFAEMVEEVEGTASVDTHSWPSWIGELAH